MNYLLLTKTGESWPIGLQKLALDRYLDGKHQGRLMVASGQPWAQNFRVAEEAQEGSYEPIPEGEYVITAVQWAGGRGNYAASWKPGIGPVWVALPKAPGTVSPRGDFGFHLDHNYATAPGSAGCPVALTIPDLQVLVSWLDGAPADKRPERLFVSWGLGVVNAPHVTGKAPKRDDELERLKVFSHKGGMKLLHKRGRGDAAEVPATQLEVFSHGGKLGVKLNGQAVDVEALTVDLAYRR